MLASIVIMKAVDSHGAGVATIEAVGHSQDRGQTAHPSPRVAIELCELGVRFLGSGPAVIPRDVRHGDLLLRSHAEEVGVEDQVVGVLVVLVVVDVIPDVVQQRGVGQDLPVTRSAADPVADRIEELQRQRLHVSGVRRLVVRAFRQLAH